MLSCFFYRVQKKMMLEEMFVLRCIPHCSRRTIATMRGNGGKRERMKSADIIVMRES